MHGAVREYHQVHVKWHILYKAVTISNLETTLSPGLSPTTRAVLAGTADLALSGQNCILIRSLKTNTKTQFVASSQFPAQGFTLNKCSFGLH